MWHPVKSIHVGEQADGIFWGPNVSDTGNHMSVAMTDGLFWVPMSVTPEISQGFAVSLTPPS